MTQHTPGPWKIKTQYTAASVQPGYYGDSGDRAIYVEGHNGPLAECFERFVTSKDLRPEECAANARLIAAAPQMLEALQDFQVVTCEDCEGTGAFGPSRPDDACDYCGGTGLVIRGGDPHAVRAVLSEVTNG